MVAESVADSRPTATRSGKRARKPFDGRLIIARRVRELVAVFSARIGDDAADPITATAIKRCAETVALSEDLRARMLRGEDVSPDDVLRTTRAADALTRRLHLDRRKPTAPTLSSYLAQRGDGPQLARRDHRSQPVRELVQKTRDVVVVVRVSRCVVR
jgi:hypothetical protein